MTNRFILTVSLIALMPFPVALAQDAEQPVSAVAPPQEEPAAQQPAPEAEPVVQPAPAEQPSVPATPEVAPSAPSVPASAPPANAAAESVTLSPVEAQINEQLSFQKPTVDPNTMQSLFFTVWEHDLLIDARRGLTSRAIDAPDDGVDIETQFPVTVGPRDIGLGGIVYRGKKDWVIWLNSMRISPNAIPNEVVDLKVYKDYIELEWYDASTRQIFPIRLRPHQRFNLDTRMFLPG